jgi:hypothetical protein
MGELVHHGPGRVQEIVLPAGVPILEAGEFGVQSDSAKNPVKRKLVLLKEITRLVARGGIPLWRRKHSRRPVVAATFPQEIFYAVFPEAFKA